jgi:hypothetical protein
LLLLLLLLLLLSAFLTPLSRLKDGAARFEQDDVAVVAVVIVIVVFVYLCCCINTPRHTLGRIVRTRNTCTSASLLLSAFLAQTYTYLLLHYTLTQPTAESSGCDTHMYSSVVVVVVVVVVCCCRHPYIHTPHYTSPHHTLQPNRLDAKHLYSSVAGAGAHSSIGKRQTMEDDEIVGGATALVTLICVLFRVAP